MQEFQSMRLRKWEPEIKAAQTKPRAKAARPVPPSRFVRFMEEMRQDWAVLAVWLVGLAAVILFTGCGADGSDTFDPMVPPSSSATLDRTTIYHVVALDAQLRVLVTGAYVTCGDGSSLPNRTGPAGNATSTPSWENAVGGDLACGGTVDTLEHSPVTLWAGSLRGDGMLTDASFMTSQVQHIAMVDRQGQSLGTLNMQVLAK